jgi:zinc protease
VVKEERRSRFDNQPYGTVIETLYRLAYTVHPYRHTAIGSMEDLDRASVSDIRAFYDTYYVPGNATLVIVGDFDSREAEALVRKYFAALASSGLALSRKIPEEPPQAFKRVLKLSQNVALPAFVTGYHMPADGTPDAYPLRLAAHILSEGESSRIYRRLIYEKQIALQAQSAGNFTEDPNLFFVFAIMNSGHTPAEGEVEVQAELERLKTELVSSEELTKAKNQILRDFVVSRQGVQSLGEELGYAAVILKDPDLLDRELDRFLAVTPEDIQRVARRYFVPENATVVEVYSQAK